MTKRNEPVFGDAAEADAASRRLEGLRRAGFTVGVWLVEPRINRLTSADGSQTVDPRVMELLVHLVAAGGDVISREELLSRVWGDAFVAENTIAQGISRLRKALGDQPQSPTYIETISKSGYRLIAPVRLTEGPRSPAPEPGPGRLPRRLAASAATAVLVVTAVTAISWRDSPSTEGAYVLATATPLLTHVGRQPDPALSPNGDQVAFVLESPDRGGWDLYVQPIAGQNPARLTERAGGWQFPAWSAESRHIVALDDGPDGCAIHRFAADGSGAARVGDCLRGATGLRWSPDGRLFAFSASPAAGGPARIMLSDAVTGEVRPLTAPSGSDELASASDVSPSFAPDGRTLAFSRVRSASAHDVMTIQLDGTTLSRLTSDSWGQIRGLDWTMDGDAVVYASNRGGQYRLWQVPRDGGTPVRLPLEDEWLVSPSLARHQNRLIYRTFNDSIHLWAADLGPDGAVTGPPRPLVRSTRTENEPALAPDGTRLAFVSDRSGTMALWSADLDGGNLVRHTHWSGPRPTMPVWSADSRAIVFGADPAGQFDLYMVGRDGSRGAAPSPLTTDLSDETNPSFSRDGKWIYFASNRSGDWQLWRMPAAGGPADAVTHSGGFFGQEDPTGAFLYFVRLDTPGIWRQPTRGGAPTLMLAGYDVVDWASWSVGSHHLYFARHGLVDNYRRPTIEAFDLVTQALTVLQRPEQQMPYFSRSLTLSADGKTLIFSTIDHSDDEVLVVDLMPAGRQ